MEPQSDTVQAASRVSLVPSQLGPRNFVRVKTVTVVQCPAERFADVMSE